MNELRDLRERRRGADDDLSPLAATFLRGLSIGTLVGAAIAGSAIWRRLRDTGAAATPADRAPASESGERP
jgi:hypothetical protein